LRFGLGLVSCNYAIYSYYYSKRVGVTHCKTKHCHFSLYNPTFVTCFAFVKVLHLIYLHKMNVTWFNNWVYR